MKSEKKIYEAPATEFASLEDSDIIRTSKHDIELPTVPASEEPDNI